MNSRKCRGKKTRYETRINSCFITRLVRQFVFRGYLTFNFANYDTVIVPSLLKVYVFPFSEIWTESTPVDERVTLLIVPL